MKNAFVLYIHSHGIADLILCSNNKTVRFYEIIQEFNDEICKNLKQIHFEAFGKQSNKIKQFSSFYQLPNLTSKPNTEYDLSKFINLLIY